MALTFERLKDSDGNAVVPSHDDLAFFVPADGMHGLRRLASMYARYWAGQRAVGSAEGVVLGNAQSGREDLARTLMSWLSPEEYGFWDETVAPPSELTPENMEGWRQMSVGGLALSIFLRVQPNLSASLKAPIVDGQRTDKPINFVPDLSFAVDEQGWRPYEPRLHITLPEDQKLAADSTTTSQWFRGGRRLVVNLRHPAAITPPAEAYLQECGIALDLSRTFTVVPHITALHSPLSADL